MLKMHNNDLNNSASSVYVTNRLNQYTDLSNLVQSCNPVYDHDGNMLTNVSHDLTKRPLIAIWPGTREPARSEIAPGKPPKTGAHKKGGLSERTVANKAAPLQIAG